MTVELSRNYDDRELFEVPTLRIADIVGDSIVDGPGIRVAVFAQGCCHHCEGCHNPDTWDTNGGKLYKADELLDIITAQNPLCNAVTFSGGEPFDQAVGFGWLALELNKKGYSVATFTGYTFEELLAETSADNEAVARLLCFCDVLVDGPYDSRQKDLSLKFCGSRNQRVLDVPMCFDGEGSRVIPFAKVTDGWAD